MNKKLFMIGNAHIDPVWLWQWQEGYQEVKATFRSALDRMKEFEDFVFTCSAASYYEWIEEAEPEMFEEIRQRVKEGRWCIVGGWWIQPDCNAPCGESFVRQALYGQRYFREKFGVTAHTGYNVDSFGHNGMLPQILKKSGMDNYVFLRPGPHEKGLPAETFQWCAPDGSKVVAGRIPYGYGSGGGHVEEQVHRSADNVHWKCGIGISYYGVGNHGGGPTIRNIECIHELQKKAGEPELVMSGPDAYFNAVRESGERLMQVNGGLFHHASGCYSAHSGIKVWNRDAENRLLMAEKFSVMGKRVSNGKYPLDKFTEAWKKVLFNQFHDSLSGTSIEPAYEDARNDYGRALSIAGEGLNDAVQSISWHIDIPMEEYMRPIVVFNPNSHAGKYVIELESPGSSIDLPYWSLVDEEGKQLPLQLTQSLAACGGRCRIVFVAELPALGYRTFRLLYGKEKEIFEDVECTDTFAENKWFSIAFDEKTGGIVSLKQKEDGTDFLRQPAAVFKVLYDDSDTWSHDVRRFDREIGTFAPESVRCIERGPVRCVIRVTSAWGGSRAVQDFAVYRDLDYVQVKSYVDWHEKFAVCKLALPVTLDSRRAVWGIPYGAEAREPDGEEYPVQRYIHVDGVDCGEPVTTAGLAILCDQLFAASMTEGEIGMTVCRSPVYAHHKPYLLQQDCEYVHHDQGIRRFTYGLYPHTGVFEQAAVNQRSGHFSQPPVALHETYHKGELPQKASFFDIDVPNVELAALKEAEDGSQDLVLRFIETAGVPCEAKWRIGSCEESRLNFEPFELKTVRVTWEENKTMRQTNLLED